MWRFYFSLLSVVSVENLLSVQSYLNGSEFLCPGGLCGNSLFLSPILEKGKIMEARNLSKVRPNIGVGESYSGYLTVNKECESNLFFWFFPAKNNWKKGPVTLWLQGGPGGSSLFGLFEEIGPLSFENNRLKQRKLSWNMETNLLFIDQPVGTGFSFTGRNCYATNETQVSEDLYSALIQFFQLFPEINKNRFILAGESYAGHYIPAIGYKIHKSNQNADFKINLNGLMIGNGWMDEMYQGDKSEYMFQIGLKDFYPKTQPEVTEYSLSKRFNFEIGLSADNNNKKETFHTISLNTQYKNYDPYNYIMSEGSSMDSSYTNFLQFRKVRRSIHVGNHIYEALSNIVYRYLINEKTKIKPLVEELLEHYPIVFYNGQLDTVCPYPLLVKFLRALKWSGAADYRRAPRHKWCEDGVLAGYHKSAGNLHEVMVRAAGHMVPKDQPFWAFRLAQSVMNNPPDEPLRGLANC